MKFLNAKIIIEIYLNVWGNAWSRYGSSSKCVVGLNSLLHIYWSHEAFTRDEMRDGVKYIAPSGDAHEIAAQFSDSRAIDDNRASLP